MLKRRMDRQAPRRQRAGLMRSKQRGSVANGRHSLVVGLLDEVSNKHRLVVVHIYVTLSCGVGPALGHGLTLVYCLLYGLAYAAAADLQNTYIIMLNRESQPFFFYAGRKDQRCAH